MENTHFATENITIDLHIHSKASQYKDGDLVEESSIVNADILINALEEKNINMFAITDHNRFDYELYEFLKSKIKDSAIIKNILPGIEFDVKLDDGFPKGCHVVCIFEDDNIEKLKNIQSKIKEVKELINPQDVYSVDEFESILKRISLKTILIVHQKQSLDNKSTSSKSLSGACEDPSVFLKTGYFDSMEYSSSKNEGVLKSSLKDIDVTFPLITGSDCHQWKAYPYRDDKPKSRIERKFSTLRCLPTFKGLLMAISSFSSRASRNMNSNNSYFKSISINGEEIPMANGINAIIGDNGAGKTLLMDYLCGGNTKHYLKLINENKITCKKNNESFQKNNIYYIKQGSINEKVREGKLLNGGESEFYDPITTINSFKQSITNYFDNLHKYVMKNINDNSKYESLKNNNIIVEAVKRDVFYPIVDSTITGESDDMIKQRKNFIQTQYNALKNDYLDNKAFYEQEGVGVLYKEALERLNKVYLILENKYKIIDKRNKARGIISRIFKDYNTKLNSLRTSEEKQKQTIISRYSSFKNDIVSYIKSKNEGNKFPVFPSKIRGYSEKPIGDYMFTKTALYDDADLKDDFYKYCFNEAGNTEAKIKNITTKDEYASALKSITTLNELEKYKETKIQGFINEQCQERTFISEISSNNKVGNTPGEISLVFYKYTIQEKEKDFCVLAIDQPEDDINPRRIKDFLLRYLDGIRDKKQVFIVTHNPLLVVNLDVDNVIFMNKENNKIKVKYGALEYSQEYSILDLIKDNLDGGYKAIEGRIKRYDRDEY